MTPQPDLQKPCGCLCHTKQHQRGLEHDAVCCDNLNGTLEWRAVRQLIIKEKIDLLNEIGESGYDPMHKTYDYNRIVQALNEHIYKLTSQLKEK